MMRGGNIHRCPLNPGRHLHMKESRESLHSAPLAQGFERQSSMFSSQLMPANPGGQMHLYPLIRSLQRAPFWQGLVEHSSISCSHLVPVYPGIQTHVKCPGLSRHVPSF